MKNIIRENNRRHNELREISFDLNFINNAEGSCLVKFGNTHVVCTATVDDRVPMFLRGKGSGWVTAEYGMLPRSTNTRMQREVSKGGLGGRTQEIQRLIGRSLRSVIDLKLLRERQIIIDCDVINADGGTRTAAITGGYIALYLACKKLLEDRIISKMPITSMISAVSCGIVDGVHLLDLDYFEDSSAEVDANFILTNDNKIIEIQATAEQKSYTQEDFLRMLELARVGTNQLFELQKQALGI
ncbi:Ribonuclease PH [Candidatus Jidaibacter acanthamoeba]|uniref:Ribonuclease PH n=1 Tax=Candidatus Jidaibacter acanthamoebae TaxID=86105 RepID=A0A0C1QWZ7_9RICK|nr:Ribonuclease PH [Candidatus Jidaibacter acanthamoeba]